MERKKHRCHRNERWHLCFLLLSYTSGFEQTAGIEFLRTVQDLLHGSLLDAYSLMHNEERVTKPLRER